MGKDIVGCLIVFVVVALILISFGVVIHLAMPTKLPLPSSPAETEKKDDTESTKADHKDPIELTIEPNGAQSRDHICLTVTVRNLHTTKAIGWDRELSIFLQWWLFPNESQDVLRPETTVARIEETKDLLAKTRFLQIDPGKSFTRTIELTKPFRRFGEDAWGGSRETRHPTHFKGYERMQRFSLDPKIKRVRVRLEYSEFNEQRLAFQAMFGFDLGEVNLRLGTGRYESNELVIAFE